MATRISRVRRDRPSDATGRVEALMKSISENNEEAARLAAKVKTATVELRSLMNATNMKQHEVDGILAEVYRPAGRATNIVDPKAFRAMVKDDSDFYAAVSVSVTLARKVLPEKQLSTITMTIPAKPGEETVRVSRLKNG